MSIGLLIISMNMSIVIKSRIPSRFPFLPKYLRVSDNQNPVAGIGLAGNRFPPPTLEVVNEAFVEQYHHQDAVEVQPLNVAKPKQKDFSLKILWKIVGKIFFHLIDINFFNLFINILSSRLTPNVRDICHFTLIAYNQRLKRDQNQLHLCSKENYWQSELTINKVEGDLKYLGAN
jgi:hypothetical protein